VIRNLLFEVQPGEPTARCVLTSSSRCRYSQDRCRQSCLTGFCMRSGTPAV